MLLKFKVMSCGVLGVCDVRSWGDEVFRRRSVRMLIGEWDGFFSLGQSVENPLLGSNREKPKTLR